VSLVCAGLTLLYYGLTMGGETVLPVLDHAIPGEYIPFIMLLFSLYVISGGINLSGDLAAHPLTNTGFLAFGALIASFIGTTGASMLLIRPLLQTNSERRHVVHTVVFFIFLVSNIGGTLLPIGDPPLFLGFLRGVPFFWTLVNVWHIWLPAMVIILGIFFVIDSRNKAESTTVMGEGKTIEIQGSRSFIFVLVIIVSVFIDPNLFDWVPELPVVPFGIREIIMFAMCYAGYKFCDQEALKKNDFSFEPIREVGWLFLGIFACMVPALALISHFASENSELLTTGMFYWGTGVLSSVLDNAPTYLNFLAAAMGKFDGDVNVPSEVVAFAESDASLIFLQAISVAAVFFGAMTYIGNAPNFMVKAIAEANNVDAPSFAGYLFKYAIPILVPVYFVIWAIFYSGWIL
jgi:Na+/H+ antiporter NhaD/arsenite permease-like protein